MNFKYLVLLPIGKMATGTIYTRDVQTPLHCTLIHWFTMGRTLHQHRLVEMLGVVARSTVYEYIELVSDRPELFGPENTIPVYRVCRNETLNLLHTRLLIILAKLGCEPVDLKWMGAGYQPHVTTIGRHAFLPGMVYRAKELVLIRCDKDGSRVVVSKHLFHQ